MMWRHLFEEETTSPSFVQQQLAFETQIYKKMTECEEEEIVKSHRYSMCASDWEKRIQKYGLLFQYLVGDRQKVRLPLVRCCKSSCRNARGNRSWGASIKSRGNSSINITSKICSSSASCGRSCSSRAGLPSPPDDSINLINQPYHYYKAGMNKSKIRKSMLAHKQDSPEMSHHLAYFPLLTLANNKMKVHAQGCHILEEECSGKLFVVGVYSRKKAIVNSIYHNNSVLSEQKAGSGVWITNYPRYSQAKQHKFLYLHVLFENSEECTRIHTICSLICSVILIDIADMETLSFLTAIASRVTHDKSSKNQKSNANKRKQQVSSLVFVKKSKNKELIGDLRRNSKEITDVLTHFAVQPQIGQLYNEITLFKLSSDCLEDSAYMCGVQEQIRSICCCNKKNEDLRSGPVIKEYLEIIITSLEQTGMVDIVSCTDLIRISEGYSAYLNAVEYYHENIKRHLKSEDIANIKEVLRGQREDAIDQYKKHSNDAEYLIRINQYIDEKEGKLIEENNKAHDLKNLAFLEESSSQLMAKISREKLSPEQVKPHVQAIIKDYQSKAAGDNKYELLTNYLSIIYNNAAKQSKSSTTNEVKSVQKELQQTRREKQALQESLEALRRKNSNKCCQIM